MLKHGIQETLPDFLAAVLDRRETIPEVQASVASLASSGFEAYGHSTLPTEPPDLPYKLVTGHVTRTYLYETRSELAGTKRLFR